MHELFPGRWGLGLGSFAPCSAGLRSLTPPHPVETRATLGRGVVVGVRVALTAVLHQEGGVVPGHAEDAVGLVQEDVRQHPAVAVHDDHLPIGSAEQHLQARREPLTLGGRAVGPQTPTPSVVQGKAMFRTNNRASSVPERGAQGVM